MLAGYPYPILYLTRHTGVGVFFASTDHSSGALSQPLRAPLSNKTLKGRGPALPRI